MDHEAQDMKTAAFYIITIGIGCIAALLVAEIVLRVAGYSSNLHYLPNPYFGWSLAAGQKFTRTNVLGQKIDVQVNRLGLRSRDYAYEKPAGAYRILVLGDSFMEALQVEQHESFAEQLEQYVKAQLSEYEKYNQVQVINAGASGYGTDNELLYFTHEGHKYDADLVIVALYIGNDIRDNWWELDNAVAGGARKPYYVLESTGLSLKSYPFEQHTSVLSRMKILLNRHLRLYSFLRQTRDQLQHAVEQQEFKRAARVPVDFRLFLKERSDTWNQALKLTVSLLEELDRQVTMRKGVLMVMLIPAEFHLDQELWKKKFEVYPAMRNQEWDIDAPIEMLNRSLVKRSIAHVDLLPRFRNLVSHTGENLYLRGDGHWSALGHRRAAEIVARKLRGIEAP